MSDSEDSTVTYIEVSSLFEDLSDIGSPRVIVHGDDGLPIMQEDPYTYPLPTVVSPTTDSPGYIIESNPEEDPEEDDEDPKEDPANYPTDRDDDDDEEVEDDVDDKEEDEARTRTETEGESEGHEDEDEEHQTPADSVLPPLIPLPLLPVLSPLPVSHPPLPAIPTHPLGLQKLCYDRYEIGESSSTPTARPTGGFRTDYGFVATVNKEIRRDPERKDTGEIYVRLNDAQEARAVLSGGLNLLYTDRRSHAHTALLMEREARLSHEAWRQSMDFRILHVPR
ncbi:hypothetical protein Tco_1388523 [Tanacetum coccineum]